MKNFVFIISFLFLTLTHLIAQPDKTHPWNGKQCAVALTYDDGLNVHLDQVIPLLDSTGFQGTFYIPGNAPALNQRMAEWRSAAEKGHELGNHTLFHPCAGQSKGREWVNPNYDLDNYTITQMVDEIILANTLLKAIDAKSSRTFAYTCGDQSVEDSVFTGLIQDDFTGARGVTSKIQQLKDVDLYDIGAYMINGQTGDELIERVKEAQQKEALLVFLFHGVGGEHNLNVSLKAHRKLVNYLKQQEEEIWVAPMVEISKYIMKQKN